MVTASVLLATIARSLRGVASADRRARMAAFDMIGKALVSGMWVSDAWSKA
jgi:hypothetical protein